MDYYMVDECEKCKKKACVVVYESSTQVVLDADVFVWRCPSCDNMNKLPIAKTANAVTADVAEREK